MDFKKMVPVSMKCFECLVRSSMATCRALNLPYSTQKKVFHRVCTKINELTDVPFSEIPPSAILSHSICYQPIQEVLQNEHPFRDINIRTNDNILQYYNEIEEIIESSDDTLYGSLINGCIGNTFDFAVMSEEEIYESFEEEFSKDNSQRTFDVEKGYDKFEGLIKDENTSSLLILGDNNGEIIFDKIFVELIRREYTHIKDIFYAVRGGPMLNDVTFDDAEYVGMSAVATVVSSSDTPYQGTNLYDSTSEFLEIFESADVIISKGMGNFETLAFEQLENLFFVFLVKCDVVEEVFDAPIGSLVFINSSMM